MKVEKIMTIYICDCCGKEMIDKPQQVLSGSNYGSNGVSYEPKVMGDYCYSCLEFAQDDWDLNNKDGFVSERYDSYDENIHQKEIECIKALKTDSNYLDWYGKNYR